MINTHLKEIKVNELVVGSSLLVFRGCLESQICYAQILENPPNPLKKRMRERLGFPTD